MKKLLLSLALLCGVAANAQEIGTPELYAKRFEDLFVAGFVLGLDESKDTAEYYFKLTTSVVNLTPAEIIHYIFLENVDRIDPMNVYKQIHSQEEFFEYIIGEQRDFGLCFVIGGYMAAARTIQIEDELIRKYNQDGIYLRCKFIYDMLVAGAIEKVINGH